MKWNRGISSKLLVTFLLVGLLPLIIFGYISISSSKKNIETQIYDNVLTTAEAKEGQIYVYLDEIKHRTEDFASDGLIKRQLKEYLGSEDLQGELSDLSDYLVKNKLPLDKNIFGIFVTNPEGLIIASTHKSEVGKNEAKDQYFLRGRNETYVSELKGSVHFEKYNPFMVTTPITDLETGEVLGVIGISFDINKIRQILSGEFQLSEGAISATGGLSKTTEVYVVNSSYEIFIEPISLSGNFAQESNELGNVATSLPITECLDRGKEILGKYTNFQNVDVIGASMCIPGEKWVLVVETALSDAFSSTNRLLTQLILFALLLFLLVILVAFTVSRKISDPIKKLNQGTEIIAAGDWDYIININTGDEIQDLGEAFNVMSKKLKQYYADLEKTVMERTKELRKKVKIISASQARDEATLTSIGDGLIAVDKNENIFIANDEAVKLLKTSYKNLIGKKFISVVDIVDDRGKQVKKEKLPIHQMIKSKQILHSSETNIKNADGEIFPVSVTASPIVIDGKFSGGVIVFRDITKEKEIDREKTEFVSLTSHQLKTPLGTMGWYLELLLAGDVGKITKKQEELLRDMFESNTQMKNLVSSLLNISRIETGRLTIEPKKLQIADIIRASVKDVAEIAKTKGCEIFFKNTNTTIRPVPIDELLLTQVVHNFITNAIKYSKVDGGTVRISLTTDDDGNYIVAVADNGIGIPRLAQDKVFKKYFRAENALEMQVEGTGLGLYITKLIMENSGGKVWFESEEGKGTIFYALIPKNGMKAKKGDRRLS